MFIIFIVLTITLPFIIYYGVQKETAKKMLENSYKEECEYNESRR